MKRYRFSALGIEVTRRCNKKCLHCMKGDAQDVTMDKKTMDKIFHDVEDVEWIAIGSGEPLLELGRIEYLINKIIESRWSTRVIELTTNGSILDDRLIEILSLFCSAKDGNIAMLRISNDQFHDEVEYQNAYSFYSKRANIINSGIRKHLGKSGILVDYVLNNSKELGNLWYEGRAVDYIDSGNSPYKHRKNNVGYPYCHNHRIRICGNTIPCILRILANGNVGFDETQSYDRSDALSIGNILSESMTEIIDNHNESCMSLCSEMDVLHYSQYGKKAKELPPGVYPYLEFHNMVCKKILELREKVKQQFPCIPAQEIIAGLPFPDVPKLEAIIIDLYKQCPEYTPTLMANIKKYEFTFKHDIYLGAACTVILLNLKNGNIHLTYPPYDFKNFSIRNKEIFTGKRNAKNDINFPCNSISGNVLYTEDASKPQGVSALYNSLVERVAATNN